MHSILCFNIASESSFSWYFPCKSKPFPAMFCISFKRSCTTRANSSTFSSPEILAFKHPAVTARYHLRKSYCALGGKTLPLANAHRTCRRIRTYGGHQCGYIFIYIHCGRHLSSFCWNSDMHSNDTFEFAQTLARRGSSSYMANFCLSVWHFAGPCQHVETRSKP